MTRQHIRSAQGDRTRRFARDLALLLLTRPDRLLAVGWWRLLGKKVRARNRLQAAFAALPMATERWMVDIGSDDLATIAARFDGEQPPAICAHLHIAPGSSPEAVRAAMLSLRAQSLPPAAVLVTGGEAVSDTALPACDGLAKVGRDFPSRIAGLRAALEVARTLGANFVVPLAPDVRLPRHALAAYAAHLARRDSTAGSPVMLYGDERRVHATPWFKPEWDARMILSQDYISAACMLPVAALLDLLVDGALPASLYESILQLLRGTPDLAVEHVPRITAETAADDWRREVPERVAAVVRAAVAGAKAKPGSFGTVQLSYPLPSPAPKVSIVVATRDRVELLRACVEGLLAGTNYPDFEVIVADNDSREPETLAYMDEAARDPRVQVVHWPYQFNYSAINNYAAGFADGEYLCLLNNDIEIVEPGWLEAMVREAAQPGVGAVGARLLYSDRSIQHAGIAIGMGNAAGHAHRALPEGDPGYFAQALIARGASAVTGACLLVARQHFDAVGGLDEEGLAVAYNDVDLCLKLRTLGLANIYTPVATLIHHESKSRGLDFAPEHWERYIRELVVFQERWGTRDAVDPWHHPRLDRQREVYR